MKQIIILCIIAIFTTNAFSQEVLNSDSITNDFSYFIKQLENTHPDPYSGFGGKVFFHIQAENIKNKIKYGSYTQEKFSDELSLFLSNLHDGHSFIETKDDKTANKTDKILPVNYRIIPDGAILSELPAKYKELLGSKVEKINGIPMDSILRQILIFNPCENIYGSYSWLVQYARNYTFYAKLFPDLQNEITFQIKTQNNEKKNLQISFVEKEKMKDVSIEKLPQTKMLSSKDYMLYQFLDAKKDVMLFKFSSVMARENFEYTIKKKYANAYNQLKYFYQFMLQKEMPADTAKAISDIPSFSETFYNMLQEMKAKKSKSLIIDLRENSGGWLPITLPSLYLLYGDRFLKTDMDNKSYTLISPLFLNKINSTLNELNQSDNCSYKLGDYTMPQDDKKNKNIEILRQEFIENGMSSIKTKLTQQDGTPLYCPEQVYVLTNTWTYSAAFQYAFYLWKMGAVVVGVPSMQAPNTFIASTPFQLPYTKINCSISNTMQVYLPANDSRAKIFYPDIMLSVYDYIKYNFDGNSEIMFLLNKIKQK